MLHGQSRRGPAHRARSKSPGLGNGHRKVVEAASVPLVDAGVRCALRRRVCILALEPGARANLSWPAHGAVLVSTWRTFRPR